MYPRPNYWESETITLRDLQHYADAQNTAIKRLYESRKDEEKPVVTQPKNPQWNAIWTTTWKKGYIFQETVDVLRGAGSERFDDTLLSDTVPAQCNVATMPTDLEGWESKFFIRPEYEEALKAALWACRSFHNIIFSGPPGIGKSVFLLLLLLWRLALGLPTGLQMDSRYFLLFWEGGVIQFSEKAIINLNYNVLKGTRDPLSRIWVLVDSNQNLIQPTKPFSDREPFFVVVAASPRPERLDWSKKTVSCTFFMKPWTFSEVLQARSLVVPDDPPSEHELWALYSDYGAPPRHLFPSARLPDFYITTVREELEKLSSEKLYALIHGDDPSPETSHLLILIEPLPDSRFTYQKKFITKLVADLFWEKFKVNQLHEMGRLYDVCRGVSTTGAIAGTAFENRVHPFLCQMRSINLAPLLGHRTTEDVNVVYSDYQAPNFFTTWKLKLTGLIRVDLTDGMTIEFGYYYRPQRTNFPSLDSLFLVKSLLGMPILVMVQITCHQKMHDVKKSGLDKVNLLVLPPYTQKVLVVITPDDVATTFVVPRSYLTDEVLQVTADVNYAFPIYYFKLSRDQLFVLDL